MQYTLKKYLNAGCCRVELSSIDYDICLSFAEHVYATNQKEYFRRNQADRAMIIRQIVVGKLAELSVFEYLQGLNLAPEFPDFTVYRGADKNFGADTVFAYQSLEVQCHIKSQEVQQGNLYSQSWLFQRYQDPLVLYPAKHANDILAFVQMDGLVADILGFVWVPEVSSCFSEPRLPRLRDNKVALYLSDLKTAGVL